MLDVVVDVLSDGSPIRLPGRGEVACELRVGDGPDYDLRGILRDHRAQQVGAIDLRLRNVEPGVECPLPIACATR